MWPESPGQQTVQLIRLLYLKQSSWTHLRILQLGIQVTLLRFSQPRCPKMCKD